MQAVQPEETSEISMIHPTALVSDKAKLGRNVSIGPYSIVHDAVILDDDVVVEAYCEIGYPRRWREMCRW